jgi:glucosamine 6-phosphate synthetase-like amidotransferase/phosphosugar isomerase protein
MTPLQMLADYIVCGADVDQPRNLAKSVLSVIAKIKTVRG